MPSSVTSGVFMISTNSIVPGPGLARVDVAGQRLDRRRIELDRGVGERAGLGPQPADHRRVEELVGECAVSAGDRKTRVERTAGAELQDGRAPRRTSPGSTAESRTVAQLDPVHRDALGVEAPEHRVETGSRVPVPAVATPISFTSISAVLLSLVVQHLGDRPPTAEPTATDTVTGHQRRGDATPPTVVDADPTVVEQPDELAGGTDVRVVLTARTEPDARIVDEQRVVRAGVDEGHTVGPLVDDELVVVATPVADDRAPDPCDPGIDEAVGEHIERCRCRSPAANRPRSGSRRWSAAGRRRR